MNTGVHVSFWISVFSVFFFDTSFPEVELVGHMVVLFLVFWETAILFSIVAMSVDIPTNSVSEFKDFNL